MSTPTGARAPVVGNAQRSPRVRVGRAVRWAGMLYALKKGWLEVRCLLNRSQHKLANRAAYRKQLRLTHTADDLPNDRAHDLLYTDQSELCRLLYDKAGFGELQRPDEVVVHSAAGQFHDETGESVAMRSRILSMLQGGKQ